MKQNRCAEDAAQSSLEMESALLDWVSSKRAHSPLAPTDSRLDDKRLGIPRSREVPTDGLGIQSI